MAKTLKQYINTVQDAFNKKKIKNNASGTVVFWVTI